MCGVWCVGALCGSYVLVCGGVVARTVAVWWCGVVVHRACGGTVSRELCNVY